MNYLVCSPLIRMRKEAKYLLTLKLGWSKYTYYIITTPRCQLDMADLSQVELCGNTKSSQPPRGGGGKFTTEWLSRHVLSQAVRFQGALSVHWKANTDTPSCTTLTI